MEQRRCEETASAMWLEQWDLLGLCESRSPPPVLAPQTHSHVLEFVALVNLLSLGGQVLLKELSHGLTKLGEK